jgi:hypothetical protein
VKNKGGAAHFRTWGHHIQAPAVALVVVGQLSEIIVADLDFDDDISLSDSRIVVTDASEKICVPFVFPSFVFRMLLFTISMNK